MNLNATNIYNHIIKNDLLLGENLNEDCSINFSYVEVDVVIAIHEGDLIAAESYDDIDSAFDRIAAEYS